MGGVSQEEAVLRGEKLGVEMRVDEKESEEITPDQGICCGRIKGGTSRMKRKNQKKGHHQKEKKALKNKQGKGTKGGREKAETAGAGSLEENSTKGSGKLWKGN